jgi:hypothetical protein
MSYDLIELTLSRLGEQLPERLSPCLESHQTDRRSDKIRGGISRREIYSPNSRPRVSPHPFNATLCH